MKILNILGIAIMGIGFAIGVIAAHNLTINPINADWTSRWLDYLSSFVTSFLIMGIGGLIIITANWKKDQWW